MRHPNKILEKRDRVNSAFRDNMQADRANTIFHREQYLDALWEEIEQLCARYNTEKPWIKFNEKLDLQDQIDAKSLEYAQYDLYSPKQSDSDGFPSS